jgi:hypothetical protein
MITNEQSYPQVEWQVEIKKNGFWPLRWSWVVHRRQVNPYNSSCRIGESFTKDCARRKALKVKRSMEDDDVRVVYQ